MVQVLAAHVQKSTMTVVRSMAAANRAVQSAVIVTVIWKYGTTYFHSLTMTDIIIIQILSRRILIQVWYRVEYLFNVHKHVFNPPPKVKSAVIRMTRNETKELGCDEKLFKQVVKTTFNQRRKTLRNSIKPILGKDCPLTEDVLFNKRPEQLSVQEFISLTNRVEQALKEIRETSDETQK